MSFQTSRGLSIEAKGRSGFGVERGTPGMADTLEKGLDLPMLNKRKTDGSILPSAGYYLGVRGSEILHLFNKWLL